MKYDEFGEQMKFFEREFTSAKLPKGLPICVRIDGKGFSKFTKKMDFVKPFDEVMTYMMRDTAVSLMEKTQAIATYVQSDEISLMFSPDKEAFFNHKVSKFNSVIASMATGFFIKNMVSFNIFNEDYIPAFDCRTWTLPTLNEATNAFLWRMQDCKRNATSTIYRYTVGKASMLNKNQSEMKDGYFKKYGKAMDESFPTENIYGNFFTLAKERHLFTDEVWDKIPEKNRPDSREYIRSIIKEQSVINFTNASQFDRTCLIFGRGS